jgi:hypothetical protein
MIHFHTAYGFPRHGLHWTDEEHATTEAAWAAVGEIVGENWRQDKARIHSDPKQYEVVKRAYARAGGICISAHWPADKGFEIPALDSEQDAMCYRVISCDQEHAPCSVTPIRKAC